MVHIFSTAYMEGEQGYSRFFAYLNLFVASMLLLVLADDLLVMFVGWEAVGVCSYLLVGFWFSEPKNGYAARKSFVVTRIADIAMLVGLLLLSSALGTLSIQPMLARAVQSWPHGGVMASMGALLLLLGGLGKSAQFPFQTWLPDAMAGPTPVSALIHAATMVTAGMYLVVRLHPLFALVPNVLVTISFGAAVTIFIASFAALFQRDIKRVLAYSTVAQIGYMFLVLGVGAWSAAMFHFVTHAAFKALLFLTAGAIAMQMHHEQDIFHMGGLRTKMPVIFWAFVIGSLSLAGLPLIGAGGFSKELILGYLWNAPSYGKLLWALALLGALLTAIYISRVVALVFFGPIKTEPTGHTSVRILLPLVILSGLATALGWLDAPQFLSSTPVFAALLRPALGPSLPEPTLPIFARIVGFLVPVLGVGIGYGLFRTGYWARTADAAPSDPSASDTNISTGPITAGVWLRHIARTGFGFDVLYDWLLVRPFLWLVAALRDDPIDRVFMGAAAGAMQLHATLRRTQIGQLRRYVGLVALGSVATIALLVFA